MSKTHINLNEKHIEAICEILKRGNRAEVCAGKYEILIYELVSQRIYIKDQ